MTTPPLDLPDARERAAARLGSASNRAFAALLEDPGPDGEATRRLLDTCKRAAKSGKLRQFAADFPAFPAARRKLLLARTAKGKAPHVHAALAMLEAAGLT